MGNIFFKSSAKASPLGLKRKLNETNDGEASDNDSDDLTTLQSKKFKYSNNTTSQLNGSKMGFSFLTNLFKRDTIWSQKSKNDIHLIDSFRSCNTSISGSGSSNSRHSTPESNKIASFSCLNSSSPSSLCKILFYLTLH